VALPDWVVFGALDIILPEKSPSTAPEDKLSKTIVVMFVGYIISFRRLFFQVINPPLLPHGP